MLRGKVLHAGYGGAKLPDWAGECDIVTLDIDSRFEPDIVADILNMGEIGKFDIIFTSHVLEHFYEYQLPRVFSEFRRVLNEDGVVIVIVPDLEGIKATEEVVYISYGEYPVTGLDMIYGMTSEDFPYMAHHTGFTKERLEKILIANGFKDISTHQFFNNLMGVGRKCLDT